MITDVYPILVISHVTATTSILSPSGGAPAEPNYSNFCRCSKAGYLTASYPRPRCRIRTIRQLLASSSQRSQQQVPGPALPSGFGIPQSKPQAREAATSGQSYLLISQTLQSTIHSLIQSSFSAKASAKASS